MEMSFAQKVGLGSSEGSPKGCEIVAGGPQTTGNRVLIAGTLKGCLRTRLKEWWHPFRVQTD